MNNSIMPLPRQVSLNIKEYWLRYYNYWDAFVKAWFDALDHDREVDDCLTRKFFELEGKNLDVNELPEPYLGFPHEKVSAVMLNMNPGSSAGELDQQKFYAKARGKSRLLDAFVEKGCSYNEYIKQYSSLYSKLCSLNGSHLEVCGVKWWQGHNGREGRMGWLRSVYDNKSMSSDEVFAIEVCPYHSRGTGGFRKLATKNRQYVEKYVLEPAAMAAYENSLPFVTCIGAVFRDILDQASPEYKEWIQKDRTYRLYKVKFGSAVVPFSANFLVTWSRGAMNKTPNEKHKELEALIRKEASILLK